MPLFYDYHSLIDQKDPNTFCEERIFASGYLKDNSRFTIAGLDEVGRGCLAGPVTTALVSINPKSYSFFRALGVTDSKKLTAAKRKQIFFNLVSSPDVLCIVDSRSSQEIDLYNILKISLFSFSGLIERCLDARDISLFLIDGPYTPEVEGEVLQKSEMIALKSGDSRSINIAAASIVAKVFRDALMENFDQKFPGYGFASNKGYGSKTHLLAIKEQGITSIHRKSFAPCKAGYFDQEKRS